MPTVTIKPADRGDAKLVTIERPKYEKKFQLQSPEEALALWIAIGAEFGFGPESVAVAREKSKWL